MNSPKEAAQAFFKAFNTNDIDAVLEHYEADGAFVQQDGTLVKGVDAIRRELSGFFQMKPRLTLNADRILENGDIAVRMQSWTMHGTGPDGSPVEMQGSGFDVVRRQSDGSWKMVLDNPWGAAILG